MEPLIAITIRGGERPFAPGQMLECQYQLDALEAEDVAAVEASVLWWTEGKGDEDFGVHYFERRTPADAPGGDLRPMQAFRIPLPLSPLSYDGAILKIRWCVRVRVFLRKGKEICGEHPFRLGEVLPATPVHETNGAREDASQPEPEMEMM